MVEHGVGTRGVNGAADGAVSLPLRFQIGARTLGSVQRRLVRVPLSLDEAIDGRLPMLPPLDPAADGYSITSLPEDRCIALAFAAGGMVASVRQRYTRYHTDLTTGFDAWLARMSGNARSGLRRKGKKVMAASGGTLDVRRFSSPEELAWFHPVARAISRLTYQERLLDAGLPDDPDFIQRMYRMAAAGAVRAWLLYIGGAPAAYLYCPINDSTVRYEYVGHDPAFADLSPGAVLQLEAMRDLFDDPRLDRFDFTEGEGQHKRQFASGGVACVDLLLLRGTLANRTVATLLAGFDRAVALAKRATIALKLSEVAKKLRR